MKKILLFTTAGLFIMTLNAQNVKRFNYEKSQMGNFFVTPLFDQAKAEGTPCREFYMDEDYIATLFRDFTKNLISKEKLEAIHLSTAVKFTFNSKGEAVTCLFLIDSEDEGILSEDDLYNLYLWFKSLKIDMTKVHFINQDIKCECDYYDIYGSLQPIEYREWYKNKK